ncbi:MAG: DUF3857 domain-containing protein [bacterium]|nr:DUF3857 domain-containing protein [bacterium]
MMKRCRELGSLLFMGMILMVASAQAEQLKFKITHPWEPVSDSDWAVVVDSAKEIRDAAVIFEKVVVNDQKLTDDRVDVTIYRRIRILSAEGRDWADAEVPLYDNDQKVLLIQARSIQQNGDSAVLDVAQIREKIAYQLGRHKVKSYTFSIPGVTDDCIVEYVMKLRLESRYDLWSIQQDIPVLKGELQWLINAEGWGLGYFFSFFGSQSPYYVVRGLDKPIDVKQLPNIKEVKELHFTVTDVPPFRSEEHTLPRKALEGRLYLFYSSSTSSLAFWERVATTMTSVTDYFADGSKQVNKVIKQFDSLETRDAKMRAAYEWLQDSITNLTYDPPEVKKSRKERQVETGNHVVSRRQGSEEQINLVYCDMLRSMNIDAHMAYVVRRDKNLFVQEALYWQFDQSLVVVQDSSGKSVYYSPGSMFLPYGFAPWYTEGVSALILSKGGRTNDLVWFSTYAANKIGSSMQLQFDQDFLLSGTFAETRTGQPARGVRLDCLDADSVAAATIVLEDLKERYARFEIDSVRAQNLSDHRKTLTTRAHVQTVDGVGDLVGDRLLLRPLELMEAAENPFTATTRVNPVAFDYAFELNESIQFVLPEGWKVESLPTDTSFANHLGNCGLQFTEFEGSFGVQRVIRLATPFIPVDDYASLQELYAARASMTTATVALVRVH